MTSEHWQEDDMLMDLAFGGLAEDDPAVRQLLSDPRAQRRLAELRKLRDELEASRLLKAEVIAALEADPPAPGEADVADALHRLSRQEPLGAQARRRVVPLTNRTIGWITAAAALVLGVLGWRFATQDAPHEREVTGYLGAGELELATPVGVVESFAPFTWTGALEPGQEFRVSVYADEELAFLPILRPGNTSETRWNPSPEDLQLLPDAIRWTVEIVGRGGQTTASAEGYARRSSSQD